jgi:hypothetical protein
MLSHSPLPTEPPFGPGHPLWLEKEDPAEVERIEELKRKQKRLEQELAEKRRQQQQAKEQPAVVTH